MYASVTPLRTLVLGLWIAGCTKTAPPETDPGVTTGTVRATSESPTPSASPREEPGPPQGPGGADELHALEGRTEAELLAELGTPDQRREFPMSECCTEFQIELYNTYPPGDPAHAQVPIREWTWKYEGYAVTIWLHRSGDAWTVLETSRYGDDVEF